jgi:hypothetical protein
MAAMTTPREKRYQYRIIRTRFCKLAKSERLIEFCNSNNLLKPEYSIYAKLVKMNDLVRKKQIRMLDIVLAELFNDYNIFVIS